MKNLQKLYTRFMGIAFLFVAFSLISDFLTFSHRPETWHKIFHVALGGIIIAYGWNDKRFWRPFSIANGAFFTFVALFGITFPNFANLDAFNTTDTILHSIVGLSGLIIGLLSSKK